MGWPSPGEALARLDHGRTGLDARLPPHGTAQTYHCRPHAGRRCSLKLRGRDRGQRGGLTAGPGLPPGRTSRCSARRTGHRHGMDVPTQRLSPDSRTVWLADTAALQQLVPVADATGWHVVGALRQPSGLLVTLRR